MNIILDNIGKSYHKKQIFQGINYQFESPNRYGISGHNGSGKSTFLKIIAGFTTPNTGTITYSKSDKSISVESIFNHISYAAPYIDIPQDLNFNELLNFHFSIKQRLFHKSNEELNSHFNLPMTIPIIQFSSGMLQRVKLALAFFTKSELLILDEPTETLDEQGFELYADLLNKFTENRITIIASNKERDFIQCKEIISMTSKI